MRFLADESCDGAVVRAPREAGHDVRSVADEFGGSPDEGVLEAARTEERILLTADRDSGHLVFAAGHPTVDAGCRTLHSAPSTAMVTPTLRPSTCVILASCILAAWAPACGRGGEGGPRSSRGVGAADQAAAASADSSQLVVIATYAANADGVISGAYIRRLLGAAGVAVVIEGSVRHTCAVPAVLASHAEELIRRCEALAPYVSLPRVGHVAKLRSQPGADVIVDQPYDVAVERASDPVVRTALTRGQAARWAQLGMLKYVHSVALAERPFITSRGEPTKAHVVHVRYWSDATALPEDPGSPGSWHLSEVPVLPE